MDLFALIVLGLAMGAVFGVALEKSRVFEPGVIVGQMQLRTFTMLKVFMSAAATGLVALAFLTGFGFAELHPKAAIFGANIIGGLLVGVGMVIAGACPGTVFAQIGAGYKDAWAILAGAVAGTIAYGYVQPALKPVLLTGGPGKITFVDLVGVPFWAAALIAAAAMVAALFALETWRPWRGELGVDYDGLISGEPGATAPAGGKTAAA